MSKLAYIVYKKILQSALAQSSLQKKSSGKRCAQNKVAEKRKKGRKENMAKANVYFTSFKTAGHETLLRKLHRLMKTAGIENIDFEDKYAAIKIHFGEYGNLAFLRPNYAKVVADYVKELGGKSVFDRLQYSLCRQQKKRARPSRYSICERVFAVADGLSCTYRGRS